MTQFDSTTMQGEASKKIALEKITNDFAIEFIYNSLSFDNFFVTKEEVQKILSGEIVDEKKALYVKNYYNGLLFVTDLLKEEVPFTEDKLKDLHEIIMKDLSVGGLYRNVDISIKGSNHTPPSFIKVYDRMKKYFDTMSQESSNVLEQAAFGHLQLMKVHPFLDGNGRCARVVLNYYLLRNGLSPVIIPLFKKEQYFTCLEEFKVNKNIKPFMDFLEELM